MTEVASHNIWQFTHFPWMSEYYENHYDCLKPIASPFQIQSYHKYNVIAPTKQEHFQQQLALASKIVESWPKWKQNILDNSSTVKIARQPVNNNDWPDY